MNGSAEVVQLAGAPLPPGIIAGGEVRDVEALGEALKEFFAKHKLPKRNVRIGLANNRIGVRTIEVAGIEDPKQLGERGALPRPGGAADPDRRGRARLPDPRRGTAADGPPPQRVLLVVAYRDLVDAYVEACRLAGIRLVGVDLEAFALLRALTARSPPSPAAAPSAARSSPSSSAPSAASSPSRTASAASTRACSTGAATR